MQSRDDRQWLNRVMTRSGGRRPFPRSQASGPGRLLEGAPSHAGSPLARSAMTRRGFFGTAAVGTLLLARPGFANEAPRGDNALLFSYFTGNGESGMHLAWCGDGVTFEALNGGAPLIEPRVGTTPLMRDPSICLGPDGTFHMVWTTAWDGRTIGYASSKDLVNWSEQRGVRVFEGNPDIDEAKVLNSWAPELYYHATDNRFIVVWASTIEDRFPETLGTGHDALNHRQYYLTTRDFVEFSPARLMYDPGFQVIDAAIFEAGGHYAMVAKNESLEPEAKYLFITFADSPEGPWGEPSPPITGDYWCEGPAPIAFEGGWRIYFDKYRQGGWGAVESADLERWEDISGRIHMPGGARHGTAFYAPKHILDGLSRL